MTARPLEGRSALVTGASQGLGLAIAHAFIAAGASVMLCARDAEMLASSRNDVARLADEAHQRVYARAADVSQPSEVEALVEAALARFERIHILVNNAGVYGPLGPLEENDWSEWLRAVEVNLHGSVLTTRALLPHFKRHRYGKIVQLSGGGATNPLPRMTAYAASKAAIVRFAESVALEVRDYGIDVNCIAPGALMTRMLNQVLDAGPAAVGQAFYDRMVQVAHDGGTPLEIGAALAVYLASAASDGITGRIISAVWDPWQHLEARRSELDASDIYTLRRITPKDRGKSWGPA